MRALNLDQLKALETVVDLGSFTGAARRLNLSQSAVSVQIRELEERFGVRLVDRLGKKAYATAAGREVIERARRIARESDAIAADMRRHREGWIGRVRLGAAPNVLTYLLPPVLKSLRERQPGIDVTIRTGITRDAIALLLRNELDLALVTLPIEERGLAVAPWRRDAMVAVLPESQTDAPRSITATYLSRFPLILDGRSQGDRMARAWLRDGGVEPRVVMELGNPEAIRNVVAVGLGASILGPEVVQSGGVVSGGVIARPLRPALFRTTAIVRRKDKPEDAAMRSLRAALMAIATA